MRFPSRPVLEPVASIHVHTLPSPRQRAEARRLWSGSSFERFVIHGWRPLFIRWHIGGRDNARVLIRDIGKMHATIFA
jgi:hypothetical protein